MSDTECDLTDIDESTHVQLVGIAAYDFRNLSHISATEPISQRISQDSLVRFDSEFSPDRLILASPPKPPVKSKLDVEERFYKHMKKVSDKVKRLGQELEENKLADCTFTPKVNSRKCKRRRSMYEYALEYEQNKQKKLANCRSEQKMQKEFAEKQLVFKPAICPLSVKLRSKSASKEPAYQQLYQLAFSIKKAPEEAQPKFIPEINKKSSTLRRSKSISDYLYKDALRRMSTQEKEKTQEIEISVRSDKMLSARFTLEFIQAIELECGLHPADLDLEKTVKVAKKLELVQTDKDTVLIQKLWSKLAKDSPTVGSDRLYDCFSAILLLSSSSVSRSKAELLHKKFFQLYHNRHEKLMPSNTHPTFKHDYSFSFKPQITPASIQKAKEVRRRRSLSHSDLKKPEDILLNEGKIIKKKLAFLKKDAEARILKDCTFSPNIQGNTKPPTGKDRNLEMYKEAKIMTKKSDTDFEQRDYEKAKSECIFQPNKDRKLKLYKRGLPPKGLEQVVDRMNKARAEQARVETILKTGIVPKESKENVRPSEATRLKVTVRLNNVNYGVISVTKGADLETLSQEFAEKNKMKSPLKAKLKEMLTAKCGAWVR
mmetsp:Transcript_20377/g.38131  ORF Transcript_20377/g.38131 Transcript_20377/m.38131 type:complete len:601 (+) Transcript_20377:4643-6445(+)